MPWRSHDDRDRTGRTRTIRSDLGRVHRDAPVDCFYIYPTLDLSPVPGNHTDFTELDRERATAAAQIGRFSDVCNVYAPLYRQATIGTYLSSKDDQRHIFDVAYSDVAAAFHAYLVHFDRGRPIVVVGHSQGAQMAARLLHDTFDQSDALRTRLLVAMPIGFTVEVPGTFEHLAPCTRRDETGCYVAFMTVAEGDTPGRFVKPPAPGHHVACVDPADGDRLRESVFPSEHRAATPFVAVKDFYRAHCRTDPDGRAFLEIGEARVPDDRRPSLVDLGKGRSAFGLHLYDLQLTEGDLVELVRVKTPR